MLSAAYAVLPTTLRSWLRSRRTVFLELRLTNGKHLMTSSGPERPSAACLRDFDGRGQGAHALRDAWDLSDEPKPFLRMLVGPYKRGQWHAMLELKIGDERTWADVQKGEISPPEWFSAFSPQYAYQWGPIPGGMGFGRRWKLTEQT